MRAASTTLFAKKSNPSNTHRSMHTNIRDYAGIYLHEQNTHIHTHTHTHTHAHTHTHTHTHTHSCPHTHTHTCPAWLILEWNVHTWSVAHSYVRRVSVTLGTSFHYLYSFINTYIKLLIYICIYTQQRWDTKAVCLWFVLIKSTLHLSGSSSCPQRTP